MVGFEARAENRRSLPGRVLHLIPRGRALPDDVWDGRHRGILILLWCHALGVAVFGVVKGVGVPHSLFEAGIVAAAALAASWHRFGRLARAVIASLGLVMSSAILVHLSGGYIEFHFHFFVMVGLLALYQHWGPFLVALGYVVLHHGVVGAFAPREVYNHPDAIAHPWRWAGVHGAFILAASVASLAAWRLNEFQALHDPLTRLANRTLFNDRVERALWRAERFGTQVAVLYVDMDDVKKVNDRLGHETGDRLLVAVGERLEGCLRSIDTVARLGGDEFAILLEDFSDPLRSEQVAERVLDAMRAPFVVGEAEFGATASIGIALGRPGMSADELVRDADLAMYEAKRAGKRRSTIFKPSMHAAVIQRLELEAALRHAVDVREFVLHYQPIVDLETEAVEGFEALVRWCHPQRGLVGPGEFIGLAEETGLILPLGRWVLEEACREAKRWELTHPIHGDLTVSVNLSARQLQHPSLVADVSEALSAAELDPARLVLEITESAVVHDIDFTIKRLHELKSLGVSLAMDDFGTGYSSLNYLRRFPIDVLKIDRSFVNELVGGEDGEVGSHLLEVPVGVQVHRLAGGGAHAVFLSGASIRTSIASAKARHFLTQVSNSSRPAGVAP